jgi:hypothetical protein
MPFRKKGEVKTFLGTRKLSLATCPNRNVKVLQRRNDIQGNLELPKQRVNTWVSMERISSVKYYSMLKAKITIQFGRLFNICTSTMYVNYYR